MAELLVHATGRVNLTNPEKDAALYSIGDVVTVQEDGWQWGRLETWDNFVAAGGDPNDWPGDFWLVKLPLVPVETAKALLTPGIDALLRWHRRTETMNAPVLERRTPGVYEEGHPRAGMRRDTMTAYKWIERPDTTLAEIGLRLSKVGITEWVPEELR